MINYQNNNGFFNKNKYNMYIWTPIPDKNSLKGLGKRFKKNAGCSDFALLNGVLPRLYERSFSNLFVGDVKDRSEDGKLVGRYTVLDEAQEIGDIDFRFNIMNHGDGLRFMMPYNIIEAGKEVSIEKGEHKVLFGMYPQTVMGSKSSDILEYLYHKDELEELPDKICNDKYSIYEFDGIRYVRVGKDDYSDSRSIYEFNNGCDIKDKDFHWFRVEPVEWIVDKDKNVCMTNDILLNTNSRINDSINSFFKDILTCGFAFEMENELEDEKTLKLK